MQAAHQNYHGMTCVQVENALDGSYKNTCRIILYHTILSAGPVQAARDPNNFDKERTCRHQMLASNSFLAPRILDIVGYLSSFDKAQEGMEDIFAKDWILKLKPNQHIHWRVAEGRCLQQVVPRQTTPGIKWILHEWRSLP